MPERVRLAKRYTVSTVAALCLGVGLLIVIVGCHRAPTPPCSPALACATVERSFQAGGCAAIEDQPFWKGGTSHKTVGIWVTYRIDAVALDPPPPSPPVAYTSRQIQPYNKVDL